MQLCASWATILLLGMAVPADPPGEFQLVAFAHAAPAAHEWRKLAEALAAKPLATQQAWLDRGPLAKALADLPKSDEQGRAETEEQIGQARSQLADGKALSAEQFEELLVLRGRLEQAAIERLARSYRIATYNAYHGDRTEYDRRRQAWENVLSAWRLAGSRPEQRLALIGWLRSAEETSGGELPETPQFATRTAVAAAPPAQPREVTPAPPARQEHKVLRPPTDMAPSPAPQLANRLDASRRPTRPPASRGAKGPRETLPAPQPNSIARRGTAAAPKVSKPSNNATAQRRVVAPRQPSAKTSADESLVDRSTASTGPARAASPRSNPRVTAPPAPGVAPHEVQRQSPSDLALQPKQPRETIPTGPALPAMEPRAAKSPARELRIAELPDRELLATVQEPSEQARDGAEDVQINVGELAVRIGGFNFALASLESQLAERGRWRAEQIEPVVQKLADLNQLRGMLGEYRQVAGDTASKSMPQLEPLNPVVTVVASRISTARADTVRSASAEAGPREVAELERLESLSERLATLLGGEEQ
jgi:hypothetical protein